MDALVRELREHDEIAADAIARLTTRLVDTQSTRAMIVAQGLKRVGLDAEISEISTALRELCSQGAESTRARARECQATRDMLAGTHPPAALAAVDAEIRALTALAVGLEQAAPESTAGAVAAAPSPAPP